MAPFRSALCGPLSLFRSLSDRALVTVALLPLLIACGGDAATVPDADPDAGTDAGADTGTTKEAGAPACAGELCDGVCIDTNTDPQHCGRCGNACAETSSTAACVEGRCSIPCSEGFFDCDGDPVNGCESNVACTCRPGESAECYGGAEGTKDVGACKAGQKLCDPTGLAFGPCAGEVLPQAEICDEDGVDEDCNGQSNEGGEGCECVPGQTEACWEGAPEASRVAPSICRDGTKACLPSGKWGPCEDQITPQVEVCDEDGVDEDCNGQSNEGGEGCECVPGQTQECWEGPPSARFVAPAICRKGTQTCQGSGKWGTCQDQVLPQVESPDVCTPNVDEDCDGDVLGPAGRDRDGDGWSVCQGDCCDSTTLCTHPKLVNPGAYDVAGNDLDDDCDGVKDNAPATCDSGLASNSSTPNDYARALDLCQFTTESLPLAARKWGVISAVLTLADGTGAPNKDSRAIRPGFGTNIVPRKGANLVVLSTGHAADANDTNPSYAAFQPGRDMGTSSGLPPDWLLAHNNVLPNAPGCPGIAGNRANDPVMLKVRVRVPTNAQSFSVNSFFLSAEFPEWVCSSYNDFFVTLLDSRFSGTPANPADKNIAFQAISSTRYPVGSNLAYLDNGFFRTCKNGTMACSTGSPSGANGKAITTCTDGNANLLGTGFDLAPPSPTCDGFGSCSLERCRSGDQVGGGTGYLTASGNVIPGETIEVRFVIWDSSDHIWDSLVLLDNWTWGLNAAQPGSTGTE